MEDEFSDMEEDFEDLFMSSDKNEIEDSTVSKIQITGMVLFKFEYRDKGNKFSEMLELEKLHLQWS